MMPLSVAALISGMMTLVATAPNLVVNSELVRHGIEGFSFFSFTPFGVPMLLLGILYMLFACRWLAAKSRRDAGDVHRVSLLDWVEKYQHAEREFRVRVTPQSTFVGKTLGEINLREDSGINVVAIERKRGFSTDIFASARKQSCRRKISCWWTFLRRRSIFTRPFRDLHSRNCRLPELTLATVRKKSEWLKS